jgi:hypothetical protein
MAINTQINVNSNLDKVSKQMKDLETISGKSVKTLKDVQTNIDELTKDIAAMNEEIAGLEVGSERFEELSNSIQQTTNALNANNAVLEDTQNIINGIETESMFSTENIEKFGSSAKQAVGGVMAISSGLALLGAGNKTTEELVKTFAKFEAISKLATGSIEAFTGITKLANDISSKLNILKKTDIALTSAQTTVTKTARTAQLGLNAAMLANPIFLVITAVTALVTAYTMLASSAEEAERAEQKAAEARLKNEQMLASTEIKLKGLSAAYDDFILSQQNEMAILKSKGATQKQISDLEKEQSKLRIQYYKDEQKELDKLEKQGKLTYDAYLKRTGDLTALKKQEEINETVRQNTIITERNIEAQNRANKAKEEAKQKIKELTKEYESLYQQLIKQNKTYQEQLEDIEADTEEEKLELEFKRRQEADEKMYNQAIEIAKKLGIDTTNITEEYNKTRLSNETLYLKKLELLEKKYLKEKQEREEEAARNNKVYEQDAKNFKISQKIKLAKGKEYYDLLRKQATDNLKFNTEIAANERDKALEGLEEGTEQYKAVWNKYFQDVRNAQEIFNDDIAKADEEQKNASIERVNKAKDELQTAMNSLSSGFTAAINGDIKSMTAAFANIGNELNSVYESMNAVFDPENDDSIAKKVAVTIQAISSVTQVVTEMLESMNNKKFEEESIERENRWAAESEAMKTQLENRQITQEEYDNYTRDAELVKQKEEQEARRKQFNANKKMQIANSIMQTAAGVTMALATGVPPASFITAAITGAMGAVQLGIISAQKFQAARGGVVPFNGKASHIDSVDAKLAPGETVINSQSSQMYPELLNSINMAGGGKNLNPTIPKAIGKTENSNMYNGSQYKDRDVNFRIKADVVETEMTKKQERTARVNEISSF